MSFRRWPDTLPAAIEAGYGLRPVDQSIRTEMEVGQRRLRRITTARRDRVQLAWRMTDTEFEAFRAWHGDEVRSLAGASDSLAGWSTTEAAITAGGGVAGPDGQNSDRIVESAGWAVRSASLGLIVAPGADLQMTAPVGQAIGRAPV